MVFQHGRAIQIQVPAQMVLGLRPKQQGSGICLIEMNQGERLRLMVCRRVKGGRSRETSHWPS